MSRISVDVSSARIPVLQVGYQGENEVTDVLFDISSWITEFGEGVAQLRVKRPGNSEEESYVLSLPITDGIAVWTVSETDTFNKGNGKVQLSYLVGNIVKKAVIYPYKVGKSIVGADNPVDPFDSWIERSKAWAIGETLDGDDVPETDETYQNNAKYYAEQADILGSAQVILATEKADAAAESEAAVNGVSTQLTTRMSAIETEQSLQSARMDTFTSLPEGSTSGNAELADIRVGADGTTYDTAGNAVRGQISELKSDLGNFNSLPLIDWTKQNTTWNGVTFSWVDDICSVSGTATADSYINIYNGELPNADKFNIHINSSSEDIFVRVYFLGGGAENYVSTNKSCSVSIPDGYSSMLVRLTVFNGVTVNGTISVDLFNCNTSNNTSALIPYIYPNTGLDCTDVIEKALLDFGCVYLDKGEYIITDLQMPDNTRLTGKGKATKLLVSDYNHHAIICGSGCTIDNVEIVGKYTTYSDTEGSDCGIYIEGNYTSQPYVYNTKISNVTIHGFNKGGIYIYNTGIWCANSVSIVNCEIYWCYAGIYTSQNAEYGRFTNIICRNNYIGCLNNGGNNIFVCCTFTDNVVGFRIHEVNAEYNGAHGSCIGCQINHSYNNNGNAIIARNVINGFVFSACQIWYGKVLVENTDSYVGKPVVFNGCEFGGGTPTITAWAKMLMNGCTFMATPTLNGWGDNRGITIANCYDADMNVITK